MVHRITVYSALLLALGSAPAHSQEVINFEPETVCTLILDLAGSKRANELGQAYYDQLDHTYDAIGNAINRFSDTLQFSSSAEAEARYGRVVAVESAKVVVDIALEAAIDDLPGPVKGAIKGVKKIGEEVYKEHERSVSAGESAEAGSWIIDFADRLVNNKPSQNDTIRYVRNEYCLLEDDELRDEFADAMDEMSERTPGLAELARVTVYEQWIRAHYDGYPDEGSITDDLTGVGSAPGMLEVFVANASESEDLEEDVMKIWVSPSTPYADKVCPRMATALAKYSSNERVEDNYWLMDLSIKKRVCFEIAEGAFGTYTACGLLDEDNDVVVGSPLPEVQALLDRAYDEIRNTSCVR